MGERKYVLPSSRNKNPTKIKARLCLRGDTVGVFDHTFAPTPYRSALKTCLFPTDHLRFKVETVDVSQAFAQSHSVSGEDQLLAIPPKCVAMPWNGRILTIERNIAEHQDYFFLMVKPLYGLRESPLRWYVHLSGTLRKMGYRQCRTYIWDFGRYGDGGNRFFGVSLRRLFIIFV